MLLTIDKKLYKKIKSFPKMCNLHIHFNTIIDYNGFKKFLNKKNISFEEIDNIYPAKSWNDMKYIQKKLRPLFKNRNIFSYIMEFYIESSFNENVIYTEFRGILGLFDNYEPRICNTKIEKWAFYVYDRVLLMILVLFKWKVKKIYEFKNSVPKHYNYYNNIINKINDILIRLKSIGICKDIAININDDIIDKSEILNANSYIQRIILMDYKFIIGHSKGISDKLISYIKTGIIVNNLLGYNFIIGFDLYSSEDKYISTKYETDIKNIIKTFPKMKYFSHAGETKLNSIGKKNISFALNNNVTRIGHAFQLLEDKKSFTIKEKIYIEVCPYSNYVLKFYDIQNHPARNYIYDDNIIISINNDDPGLFGYTGLTYDYYLIYIEWKLNNSDLCQLALNSINSALQGGLDNNKSFLYTNLLKKLIKKHIKKYE